jgi:hypothetical protein
MYALDHGINRYGAEEKMKLSELIKELQDDLKASGDVYIYESKIVDENQHTGHKMISLHRRDKNGNKAKMTFKEFEDWVKNERAKEPTPKKTIYNTYPACGNPGHVCSSECKR